MSRFPCAPHAGALTLLAAAAAASVANAAPPASAAPAPDAATPVAATLASAASPSTLSTVRIDGASPTSLPSRIPTTLETLTAAEIARDINATDAEDALKYLPSLLVRKRYIGDYNHAVLSTRASGTGNSARSLVYADGILLSNLLGNGAAFTPRWGLIAPEEIRRVDVMYGPFSAAYSGNAVGAVVDYQTRMPTRFEAHVRAGLSHQPNDLYGGRRNFDAHQLSASVGSAAGPWSWWLSLNRLDSEGQPQTFATRLLTQGLAPTATAVPVTGAVQERNRQNADWLILGTGAAYETTQDQAKLKVAYDVTPTVRAQLLLGGWRNRSEGSATSLLRSASGAVIDHRSGGTLRQDVLIDGRRYTLTPADFPATRDALQHRIQALSLKQRNTEGFGWEIAASGYDYLADRSRAYAPTDAQPGAGRLTDQAGTGWTTLSAKGSWTPAAFSDHTLDAGLSQERYALRNRVFSLADWRQSAGGPETARFEGDTQLRAAFVQDAWQFAPDWTAVLGLRAERWTASDGLTRAGANTLAHPSRAQTAWSPKAALAWGVADQWTLKASTGRAVRFPTVSELFQGGFNNLNQPINNDPTLRPERSWTSELSAEWTGTARDSARVTLFHEDSREALYAQLNPATNANTVQNIDHLRTRGVEVAGRVGLLRTVSLTASATFADSVILANRGYAVQPGDTVGRWQPRVPRWRATVLAQWQAREDLSLTVGARYSGRQYGTLDNSDPNGDAYMGASRYLTVDLRAQWQLDRHWTLAAGIDNVNNERYWNFHPYPQRTFHAELRWDW